MHHTLLLGVSVPFCYHLYRFEDCVILLSNCNGRNLKSEYGCLSIGRKCVIRKCNEWIHNIIISILLNGDYINWK